MVTPGAYGRGAEHGGIARKSNFSSIVPFHTPFYFCSGSMHPGASLAGLFTSVLTGYATMFSDG